MAGEQSIRPFVEIIDEFVESDKLKLPVFPEIVSKLQKLLADPDISIHHVAKLISMDQGLVFNVMKLANSGFFRGLKGVKSLDQAIIRIGLSNVSNYIIAIKQATLYNSTLPILDMYLKVSRTHALCTAIGAQWLMNKIKHSELTDIAFLSGLMHDIGKLFILKCIELVRNMYIHIEMTDTFVIDTITHMHTQIGYKLMNKWGMQTEYCQVALHHHDDNIGAGDVLLMVVRIANQACRKVGVNTISERQSELPLLQDVMYMDIRESVITELETVIESVIQFNL